MKRFIVYVGVGEVPPSRSIEFVNTVREGFKPLITDDLNERWAFIAVRGQSNVWVEALPE